MFSFLKEIFSIVPLADGGGGTVSRLASEFHVEWPLLIAQTLNFCVVAFLLYRFAFKPLLNVVDARQKRISDGLQYAEEMREQLAQTEVSKKQALDEATAQARKIVEDAISSANTFAEQQRAELTAKLDSMRVRERERLQQDYQTMMEEARQQLQDEVVILTGKVLQKDLSEKEKKTIASNAVEEIAKEL